mmetsp:Transcript_22247/g.71598  ORF Transcript_22247/g.71598 Transcript_22247/m.71598 type:complete len:328 (+) Transcript_22247:356-1339(+)
MHQQRQREAETRDHGEAARDDGRHAVEVVEQDVALGASQEDETAEGGHDDVEGAGDEQRAADHLVHAALERLLQLAEDGHDVGVAGVGVDDEGNGAEEGAERCGPSGLGRHVVPHAGLRVLGAADVEVLDGDHHREEGHARHAQQRREAEGVHVPQQAQWKRKQHHHKQRVELGRVPRVRAAPQRGRVVRARVASWVAQAPHANVEQLADRDLVRDARAEEVEHEADLREDAKPGAHRTGSHDLVGHARISRGHDQLVQRVHGGQAEEDDEPVAYEHSSTRRSERQRQNTSAHDRAQQHEDATLNRTGAELLQQRRGQRTKQWRPLQ